MKVPAIDNSFSEIASSAIENSFRVLLESKHLYQSVEIPTNGFANYLDREVDRELSLESLEVLGRNCARKPPRTKKQIQEGCQKILLSRLQQGQLQLKYSNHPIQTNSIIFSLPTIKAVCQNPGCGGLWPHNSCPDASGHIPSVSIGSVLQQIFILLYQCQACKKVPISFLVKKDGLKLTLTGRSPMEAVDVPRFLPNSIKKFYKGAILASDCGANLPGIFMLRTMIEQHMRESVSAGERKMTGDDLTDAYAETLHPDFNRRFQSLKPVYSTLSEAIHAATDDNPEIFEIERTKILSHFEAKEAFERLTVGK